MRRYCLSYIKNGYLFFLILNIKAIFSFILFICGFLYFDFFVFFCIFLVLCV
ncbi:unnamed protein product [Meloidogyne enterolobii]|uniref:Uncharacterized protein n=1 Tax=Meloidogyne enterolobii TaxID=390850 RepID=A0ACB1AUQ9_MELEN